MIIDGKLEKIMNEDIIRCEEAQKSATGSCELFQILISKYDGIFENFKDGIEVTGKVSTGGPFNYRPELNAIKEKLEVLLAVNETKLKESDTIYEFKKQFKNDLKELEQILVEIERYSLDKLNEKYRMLIAKYSKIVPNFGDNIIGYRRSDGFYFDVDIDAIKNNLKNMYEKMNIFMNLGFMGLDKDENRSIPLLQINNNNQNTMEVNLTFEQLKEKAENLTSVNDEEIDEILNKITEIEEICKTNDRKAKKWEKIKNILIWIMDKGVDVAIQLIPSIITNLK